MAGFGSNVNRSGGDDGHGCREMRIALEAAGRTMEQADLDFHEVRIGVDRDDKGLARYLEGRECRRSPCLVRAQVGMCCDVALTLMSVRRCLLNPK